MGKINEFLALSALPILHADNGLYRSVVCTIEASRHWAGCHMPLHVMAQHCYSSSLDMCSAHSQRSHWWTMEWCASSHIPQGSIELSNEPLQHALAAGAARKCHLAPSQPLIFNLFGMCNRLWSGAWRSVDLCQPGLRIWRDRCQPSAEGAVLNTLRWVGDCTILALWCRLLELPVSCCSSQASFYFGNRTL